VKPSEKTGFSGEKFPKVNATDMKVNVRLPVIVDMKLYTLALLWVLLLIVPTAASAQDAGVDQKVSAALALAKKNDLSAVYSLCESYGAGILPHFRRHIMDVDPDIRLAVETAAAQFNSPLAKEILLQLVRDPEVNVSENALGNYVRLFPPAGLDEVDGKSLNDALLALTRRGGASSQSLLLLAYFPQTPKTVALLNSLHTKGSNTMDLEGAYPAERNTLLDVTLTQLGDKAAGERIAALLRGGPVASLTDVIVTIPYMADAHLLLQATELLKDTRLTSRTRGGAGYGGPGTPLVSLPYKRVCDLALDEFAKRKPSGVSLDTSVENRRPFTQEELDKSYDELRAFYKTQAERK